MKNAQKVIAGLDIGSTKVVVTIAVPSDTGVDIVGVGTAASQGLRRGTVVNIEATTEAISKAREEAELMAGVQAEQAWVGVSGSHLNSFDSRGIVAIRNQEVTSGDVERVIEAAKTVAVPADRQVIHVLPREYKIDDQDGIFDPVGMTGVRLESNVHIVTGSQTALSNVSRCVERSGLKVAGFVLQQLASAKACLSEDERNMGVALLDLGGGTSDLIIISQGSVAYSASIPLGSQHITNDIAVGLRTPPHFAETLKLKYGCALSSLVDGNETIEVEGVGGRRERTVLRQYLCEIIEPRAEEILSFANAEIQKSGLGQNLGAGIILTGGGSLLDGMLELGEFVFDLPVQKKTAKNFGGLVDAVNQPTFATSVGLVQFGQERMKLKPVVKAAAGSAPQSGWIDRLKDMIDGAF